MAHPKNQSLITSKSQSPVQLTTNLTVASYFLFKNINTQTIIYRKQIIENEIWCMKIWMVMVSLL